MKKNSQIIFVLLIVAVAAAGLIFAYLKMSKERDAEKAQEKPVTAESRIKKNDGGESTIVFDVETQKRIALEVAPLVATDLQAEIKGYGRVIDPSPLALLGAEVASAQVAANASRQEYERLKTLGENTAAKNLQAAEAVARRDELAFDSAKTRLKISFGKAIAEKKDLLKLVDSLASSDAALVRIDLPSGENISALPSSARIVPLGSETNFIEATFLSVASNVEAQTQSRGFLFLAEKNSIAPGTAVTGYLKFSGEPTHGVIIPRSAVLRLNGKLWIYLQSEPTVFVRHEISADFPTEAGFFLTNFNEKNSVVVSGAQTLLSEEQKSQIKMAD